MSTDFFVKRVIDEIRPMLAPDGGDVQLLSYEEGTVKVSYEKGHNDECFDCVMPPEDFREYLLGLYRDRVPEVSEVEVISA
jgi:Fe-S cluster biogenesis protein NfuA